MRISCYARVELITMLIVNIRSISYKYAAEFLRFGIFPPEFSDSCGATYRRKFKVFSALQRSSGALTNSEIIGDAIITQTGTKY